MKALGYSLLTILTLLILTGFSPLAEKSSKLLDIQFDKRESKGSGSQANVLNSILGDNGGMRRECLGRISFEVNRDAEWPTFYGGSYDNFPRKFSDKVFNTSDIIKVGNVKIAVFYTLNTQEVHNVKANLPTLAKKRFEERIVEAQEDLKNFSSENKSSEYRIAILNDRIESYKKRIEKLKSETFNFDTGVVGCEGYGWTEAHGGSREDNYSVYRAYITRGHFIYTFESTHALDAINTKLSHARTFANLLRNFRPRQANNIPTEPGICIPHGFIQDDGKTQTDIKQSFRMPDALGVLYTIHTGSYENSRGNVALKSRSYASVGQMGTPKDEEVKPFVTERIGPRSYKIGGVSGLQGGVAARITEAGAEPYETYSVFTGYPGREGSETLPFIFVQLNTTTMKMAPELKENPPPFKQSMGRYEALLKSIRLRPTIPAMPGTISTSKYSQKERAKLLAHRSRD